jgi:two-component system sensor histidine kinase PhoQ
MKKSVSKSIHQRLLITTLPLLAVFLILAGLGLDRAYQRSAADAEFQKLQLQAWSLMADAEIEEQKLMMPEQLQEPRVSGPESELLGFVVNSSNQRQWQSASAALNNSDLTAVTKYLSALYAGQSERMRLASGEFVFKQGVTYVSEQHEKNNLTFIVVELGKQYQSQLSHYRQSVIFWLGLVLLVLLFLQILALRWGLFPLRTLTHELADLEQGKRNSLSDEYPTELLGVTENLNQLLASKNAQQTRYRNTLSDLAHSLKTPLAVLQSRLELSNHQEREALLGQIDLMDSIVSRQLKRAVIKSVNSASENNDFDVRHPSEASDLIGKPSVSLNAVLTRLCNALQTVYQDKAVQVDMDIEDVNCPIDESDLMEMLGGVLDNAFKYCVQRIQISTELDATIASTGGFVSIIIEDDGQGIPSGQYDTVLERGVRLDSNQAGQGIGLTVTSDIIDAYGGELQLAQADSGGAKIILSVPCLVAH